MSLAEDRTGQRGIEPVYDRVYDRVCDRIVDEFLSEVLGDSKAVADFEKDLARSFLEGPARSCYTAIGDWIVIQLHERGWTQAELAERVHIDGGQICRWAGGKGITLGNLMKVMMAFQCDFVDLPMFERRELAREAYIAALGCARKALDPAWDGRPLDREGFWWLFYILSERFWQDALRERDDLKQAGEFKRVGALVRSALGHKPRSVTDFKTFLRLVEDWTKAWLICLNYIPDHWAVR